jgi:hypothetical protein
MRLLPAVLLVFALGCEAPGEAPTLLADAAAEAAERGEAVKTSLGGVCTDREPIITNDDIAWCIDFCAPAGWSIDLNNGWCFCDVDSGL